MFAIVPRAGVSDVPASAHNVVPFPRRAVHPQPMTAPNWSTITPMPAWDGEEIWAGHGYADLAKSCDLRAVLGL